jgi:adenosylcobyric acid synthase
MVQGTASSVGKSLLAAALCRIFARKGYRVAPFKSQNMSNNAAALADGSEIGRAQFLQAMAARVEPSCLMNPILLKPESDKHSQVILMGKPWASLGARDYYEHREKLWEQVVKAYRELSGNHEILVIEGAGSPAEINLASSDIVNMAVARMAGAPVILVADIDPGGVFAQIVGTLSLLSAEDRSRVRGIVINKFRGDISLLEPGLRDLEIRTGLPVLGVLPMLKNLELPDEDKAGWADASVGKDGVLDVAVINLPHISNFDDFDPLSFEPGVRVRYIEEPKELGLPDILIVPGTKATRADLEWLKTKGLDDGIRWMAALGKVIVGICGGYQMLGEDIDDPEGLEGRAGSSRGLGLLSVHTLLQPGKVVLPRKGRVAFSGKGALGGCAGVDVTGYEIHCGRTHGSPTSFVTLESGASDGSVSPNGRVWGTYLHGIFGSDEFRWKWLEGFGLKAQRRRAAEAVERSLERLADVVEQSLDMKKIFEMTGVDV